MDFPSPGPTSAASGAHRRDMFRGAIVKPESAGVEHVASPYEFGDVHRWLQYECAMNFLPFRVKISADCKKPVAVTLGANIGVQLEVMVASESNQWGKNLFKASIQECEASESPVIKWPLLGTRQW